MPVNHTQSILVSVCVFMGALLLGCSDQGALRYSPTFENQFSLAQVNVCATYPEEFSTALSADAQQRQTALETRTTEILKKYATGQGRVRYAQLFASAKDRSELDELVGAYASRLKSAVPVRPDEKADWINLYNLATIDLIVENYAELLGTTTSPFPGIKSIQNIRSLGSEIWNSKDIPTSRGNLSLNEIERELQKTKDPRIHFAINCASIGCPPLLDTAYVGGDLDRQLNERTCGFVNSGSQTIFDNLDPQTPIVFTSQILRWYSQDFGDLYVFFGQYLSQKSKDIAPNFLERSSNGDLIWKIEFDDYSWELNEEVGQ